jgi:hypothetical protein
VFICVPKESSLCLGVSVALLVAAQTALCLCGLPDGATSHRGADYLKLFSGLFGLFDVEEMNTWQELFGTDFDHGLKFR